MPKLDLCGASELTGLTPERLARLCQRRTGPPYTAEGLKLVFDHDELLTWCKTYDAGRDDKKLETRRGKQRDYRARKRATPVVTVETDLPETVRHCGACKWWPNCENIVLGITKDQSVCAWSPDRFARKT